MRMSDKCKWIYDEYHDYWDTKCGEGQIFTDGGPKENKYRYCPYCGKEIEVSERSKSKDE